MSLADEIREVAADAPPDPDRLRALAAEVARLEMALNLIVHQAQADAQAVAALAQEIGRDRESPK